MALPMVGPVKEIANKSKIKFKRGMVHYRKQAEIHRKEMLYKQKRFEEKERRKSAPRAVIDDEEDLSGVLADDEDDRFSLIRLMKIFPQLSIKQTKRRSPETRGIKILYPTLIGKKSDFEDGEDRYSLRYMERFAVSIFGDTDEKIDNNFKKQFKKSGVHIRKKIEIFRRISKYKQQRDTKMDLVYSEKKGIKFYIEHMGEWGDDEADLLTHDGKIVKFGMSDFRDFSQELHYIKQKNKMVVMVKNHLKTTAPLRVQ